MPRSDGLAQEDVEAHRHQCEVNFVVDLFWKEGADGVKRYLLRCEKYRGSEATERLRNDAKVKIRHEKENVRTGR